MAVEGDKNQRINSVKNVENQNWSGNMLDRNDISSGCITLSRIISQLSKAQRERLIAGYDVKNLARIFEDEDIMNTVDCFFKCGMNVSDAARKLYMHRNTLIYRLNKVQTVTGLDVRMFDTAVTFEILRAAYRIK